MAGEDQAAGVSTEAASSSPTNVVNLPGTAPLNSPSFLPPMKVWKVGMAVIPAPWETSESSSTLTLTNVMSPNCSSSLA